MCVTPNSPLPGRFRSEKCGRRHSARRIAEARREVGLEDLYSKRRVWFPSLLSRTASWPRHSSAARRFNSRRSSALPREISRTLWLRIRTAGFDACVFIPAILSRQNSQYGVYGARIRAHQCNYDQVNRLCAQIADGFKGPSNVNLRHIYPKARKRTATKSPRAAWMGAFRTMSWFRWPAVR